MVDKVTGTVKFDFFEEGVRCRVNKLKDYI